MGTGRRSHLPPASQAPTDSLGLKVSNVLGEAGLEVGLDTAWEQRAVCPALGGYRGPSTVSY